MLIPGKKKRVAVYSVILIIIVIFGVIFPVYHFYDPLFKNNPAITVSGGYYNVTFARDFKNLTDTANSFLFTTNASRTIVADTGHPDSTLDVSAVNGQIFFNGAPNNVVTIIFDLLVSGHFTNNLHPASLTISFAAVGQNQSSVLLTTTTYTSSSVKLPTAENISTAKFVNLQLEGYGNVSATTGLLNESSSVPFYNFCASVQMWLTVKWYTGSSHLFDLSAQVNGLSKPVNSSLSMTIVEAS